MRCSSRHRRRPARTEASRPPDTSDGRGSRRCSVALARASAGCPWRKMSAVKGIARCRAATPALASGEEADWPEAGLGRAAPHGAGLGKRDLWLGDCWRPVAHALIAAGEAAASPAAGRAPALLTPYPAIASHARDPGSGGHHPLTMPSGNPMDTGLAERPPALSAGGRWHEPPALDADPGGGGGTPPLIGVPRRVDLRGAQRGVRASPLLTRRSKGACVSAPSQIPVPRRFCCAGCKGFALPRPLRV